MSTCTGIKFLHGQVVCLGLIEGAMMHGKRVDELRNAVADIGVDIRPESMGLTWADVDATLLGMREFVRENDLALRMSLTWIECSSINCGVA